MAESAGEQELLRQHLRELGRKGGHTVTDAKRQSLAKAREIKEFYRRNPGARPVRQGDGGCGGNS